MKDKSKVVSTNTKLKILNQAKINLKTKFIGIDDIIDQLFECIHIWYLMPQILMRPMVINLWGMTGVGKTDLIRSLVKELGMEDKFLEVELSSEGSSYGWDSSIADTFGSRGFEMDSPNIVLFDEIQKFRSIDEKGDEVKVKNFQDLWELLSDGKISDKGKGADLLSMFHDSQYTKLEKEDALSKKEDFVDSKIGIWQATRLKKMIKSKYSVMDIARMTFSSFAIILEEMYDNNEFYSASTYNQTLIIISGNLDEAYIDSKSVGEIEIDADIFHQSTSKINILNIKEALSKRFRPEQISRFGNIHLIYKSLSKDSYHKLIRQRIDMITNQILTKLGIEVIVDITVEELIYNNGVFPAQGVRPVFSTITEILECNLSKYLFEAKVGGFGSVMLSYYKESSTLKAILQHGKNPTKKPAKIISTPFVGRIDQIKLSENTKNLRSLVSVHESGHALMYILNFGLAPIQLKSNVASTSSAGFTFSHTIHLTRNFILLKIQVLLAGYLAEKQIFGEDNCSFGHTKDLQMATALAADYVRRLGFGDESISVITNPDNVDADNYNTNIELSNTEIEDIIRNQVFNTNRILQDHRSLLMELAKGLFAKSSLSPAEIASICTKYKVKCQIQDEKFTIYEDYSKALES